MARQGGGGGGNGDDYGDLYVIQRDLEANGALELDEYGNVILISSNGEDIYFVDGEIPADNLPFVQEVEFSRLSMVRTKEAVLERALDEVLDRVAVASEVTTDDPAGRLVVDGVTVDSPRENMAVYKYILNNLDANALGDLGTLDTPASMFGAAADKMTPVTADTLVYSNTILGLNTNDAGEVEYYNFDGYDYSRVKNYGDADISWFEGDADGNGQLDPHTESVLDAVFGDQNLKPEDRVGQEWPDRTSDLKFGFDDGVQAADDARAVIDFMHTSLAEGAVAAETVAGLDMAYGMAYGADGDCPLDCPLLT